MDSRCRQGDGQPPITGFVCLWVQKKPDLTAPLSQQILKKPFCCGKMLKVSIYGFRSKK